MCFILCFTLNSCNIAPSLESQKTEATKETEENENSTIDKESMGESIVDEWAIDAFYFYSYDEIIYFINEVSKGEENYFEYVKTPKYSEILRHKDMDVLPYSKILDIVDNMKSILWVYTNEAPRFMQIIYWIPDELDEYMEIKLQMREGTMNNYLFYYSFGEVWRNYVPSKKWLEKVKYPYAPDGKLILKDVVIGEHKFDIYEKKDKQGFFAIIDEINGTLFSLNVPCDMSYEFPTWFAFMSFDEFIKAYSPS